MAIRRVDEVLDKALSSDPSVIPRYNLVSPDGTVVAENVQIVLQNPVLRQGMPINKQAMDECLAASGTTGGTATALTLSQQDFGLVDGATIRFKVHTRTGSHVTLNVNNTGAHELRTPNNQAISSVPQNTWITAIYSSSLSYYIVQGTTSSGGTFGNGPGQVSTFERFFRGTMRHTL